MTSAPSPAEAQKFYARKLYALLQEPTEDVANSTDILNAIPELADVLPWWEAHGKTVQDIGSASDRVSLHENHAPDEIKVRHPISGQQHTIEANNVIDSATRIKEIAKARERLKTGEPSETLRRLFIWCWRFYPDLIDRSPSALLNPAHRILPDCPVPSYNSTVSAITGAMFPPAWQPEEQPQKPYLLLFTFSPVQEFIKASRKFADFWSGSYMLHYLSAQLCWCVAEEYGPDAVITPSLWNQEIIDALLTKSYEGFAEEIKQYSNSKLTPVEQFNKFKSRSLSTAGFPNAITVLVPGREKAIALGKKLENRLEKTWCNIAEKVREHIKSQVIEKLSGDGFEPVWEACKELFPESEWPVYKKELHQLQQHGCWEWNKLWNAQIENTWQPYFVAVPLGHPEQPNIYSSHSPGDTTNDWIAAQNSIAQPHLSIPTQAEQDTYDQFNVGTWWGSLQARLGQSMQAIKNTRRWQIPTAPGERSSLSGQFSAVHPRLHYEGRFKSGRGMAAGSIRLFWKAIALTYPGLFDGSERLNALELTKRMGWVYGDVAETLGIDMSEEKKKIASRKKRAQRRSAGKSQVEYSTRLLYERFSRFPNLSSIAAARFTHDHPEKARSYWQKMDRAMKSILPEHRRTYRLLTQVRPSNIPKTDQKINPERRHRENLNGVMFSSKWLAQDLGLQKQQANELRRIVNQAHKQEGFGESSPGDWWVLLLADGDGMGQYVSGRKLKDYDDYLVKDLVDRTQVDEAAWEKLLSTKKRMGPATHVGLNRALLDFSNRLVPHLTEHRYCGRVIYSGGDDVLVALPLADLPGFVRSLRAAWCGGKDPEGQFEHRQSGYWHPTSNHPAHLPKRPLFTMGTGATMSMGIVIAHKSVPLPTVLENLWDAEKEQAKKMLGGQSPSGDSISPKDGLCFRVIYGSGNTSEALMKGHLLDAWWEIVKHHQYNFDLSPVLNRLSTELPQHAAVTEQYQMCRKAAESILLRREDQLPEPVQTLLLDWISQWEAWAWAAQQTGQARADAAKGTTLADLAALLRFTAFWISRRRQELMWADGLKSYDRTEDLIEDRAIANTVAQGGK